MTQLSTFGLPAIDGRAVRIAFVVYNDTYGDTRVLKEAETAVQAGAQVRIFAIGGPGLRFSQGVELRSSGVEIERLRMLGIGGSLTRWGLWLRKLLHKPAPPYVDPRNLPPAEAKAAIELVRESQLTGAIGVLKRSIIEIVSRIDSVLNPMSFLYGVRSHIAAWKPDLIHAHDANTLFAAGPVAKRLHVPFVYDSHELWTGRNMRMNRPVAKRIEGPNERYWARRAAGVITVSPSIAEWLKENYELRETPVLVRNIPPFNGELPGRAGGRLRELAGLPSSAKVVAYCGGITTNRGIEESIDATAHLPRDTHFVLLGHGNELFRGTLIDRAKELGVDDRVHFIGSVPSGEVSAALADADVSLVLTRPTCLSYEYSLPNKLFESIHAGIPILATRLVDVAALIDAYDVGETVEVGAGATQLATRIQDVIVKTEHFRESAERAASRLAWANEADRLVGAWSRAMGLVPVVQSEQCA
jgi:glycosyltransferase involved in cell wall biosynthesis